MDALTAVHSLVTTFIVMIFSGAAIVVLMDRKEKTERVRQDSEERLETLEAKLAEAEAMPYFVAPASLKERVASEMAVAACVSARNAIKRHNRVNVCCG